MLSLRLTVHTALRRNPSFGSTSGFNSKPPSQRNDQPALSLPSAVSHALSLFPTARARLLSGGQLSITCTLLTTRWFPFHRLSLFLRLLPSLQRRHPKISRSEHNEYAPACCACLLRLPLAALPPHLSLHLCPVSVPSPLCLPLRLPPLCVCPARSLFSLPLSLSVCVSLPRSSAAGALSPSPLSHFKNV